MTEIVFNNKEEQFYSLEKELTNMAKLKNTYTIAVLDCCRIEELQVKKPET